MYIQFLLNLLSHSDKTTEKILSKVELNGLNVDVIQKFTALVNFSKNNK